MIPAINPVIAAIINLLPAKLPESHSQRKENFARLSCHFSIQSANEHDHTPIDKNQPFSAVADGVGGDDAADALRYMVATQSRAVMQRKLRGL
jgi:serine/threonine protein phosphatase PrpC